MAVEGAQHPLPVVAGAATSIYERGLQDGEPFVAGDHQAVLGSDVEQQGQWRPGPYHA